MYAVARDGNEIVGDQASKSSGKRNFCEENRSKNECRTLNLINKTVFKIAYFGVLTWMHRAKHCVSNDLSPD